MKPTIISWFFTQSVRCCKREHYNHERHSDTAMIAAVVLHKTIRVESLLCSGIISRSFGQTLQV